MWCVWNLQMSIGKQQEWWTRIEMMRYLKNYSVAEPVLKLSNIIGKNRMSWLKISFSLLSIHASKIRSDAAFLNDLTIISQLHCYFNMRIETLLHLFWSFKRTNAQPDLFLEQKAILNAIKSTNWPIQWI